MENAVKVLLAAEKEMPAKLWFDTLGKLCDMYGTEAIAEEINKQKKERK